MTRKQINVAWYLIKYFMENWHDSLRIKRHVYDLSFLEILLAIWIIYNRFIKRTYTRKYKFLTFSIVLEVFKTVWIFNRVPKYPIFNKHFLLWEYMCSLSLLSIKAYPLFIFLIKMLRIDMIHLNAWLIFHCRKTQL